MGSARACGVFSSGPGAGLELLRKKAREKAKCT
jgi:hypothetical protein